MPPKHFWTFNFGMEAHIGADRESGMLHCVAGTAANVAVVPSWTDCCTARKPGQLYSDKKRAEHVGRTIIWQIAARHSTYKRLSKRSPLYKARRKIEKAKAQVRAKDEHPFRVIKCQFGCTKVRFRGLAKNTAQLVTLFALLNLWMARRYLLVNTGEVRL